MLICKLCKRVNVRRDYQCICGNILSDGFEEINERTVTTIEESHKGKTKVFTTPLDTETVVEKPKTKRKGRRKGSKNKKK